MDTFTGTDDEMVAYMLGKNYLVMWDSDTFSTYIEPPLDEHKSVRSFWLALSQEQTLRRFRKAFREAGGNA